MNPVDPRTLELIHAELDGELDGVQRDELEARLAADPVAREQREQWRRIAGALAKLPSLDPPSGLGRRWQGGSPATPDRRPLRTRRWLRPAIGLAAGGMLLAIALGMGGFGRQLLDADGMVATIGGDVAGVQRVPVDVEGVTGEIALLPASAGWILDFDLRSERPAAITATWESSALALREVRGTPSQAGFEARPGRIAFVVDPAQHLSVELAPGEGGQVRIRIQGREGDARELAITVPPAPSSNR